MTAARCPDQAMAGVFAEPGDLSMRHLKAG
jgi:hypothetical protein